MCSLAARGLWAEMLALMQEAAPCGHLLISGRAPTDAQLAVLAGAPSEQIPGLLGELESAGVFSRTREGVIYSRRMVRDEKKAREARKNGKCGGNPSLRKQDKISSSVNPHDKGADKAQKPEARSQKPEETTSAVSPRVALDVIEEKLREAANLQNDPSPGLLVVGPILGLIEAGADLDRDILPVVRAKSKGRKIRSWAFFIDAVREAMGARTAAASVPLKADDPPVDWEMFMGLWARSKIWPQRLGPPPGFGGCRAPPEVLARHGYAAAA